LDGAHSEARAADRKGRARGSRNAGPGDAGQVAVPDEAVDREGDVSADAGPSVYALLTDGTTIEIRPARPDDLDAVRDMHEKLSPDSLYLRFFSMSPRAAEQEARRLCREPAPDHAALLALLDGELIGCGSYECDDLPSQSAEVAFTVADDMHHRGVGMLLLEHLISLARSRGLRAFTAETLERAHAESVRRRRAAGAPRPGRRRVRPHLPAAHRRGRHRPRQLP
jgi:GNAT superfamily N-acetyltransferase